MATLLKTILGWILEWTIGKLVAFIQKRRADQARQEEIQHEAEQSVKPLQDAKTGKEVDDATDSALDGF